jgi:LemA protein
LGYVLTGVSVLLVIFIIVTYNNLVTLWQRVDNAWVQIDTELQKRYDLVDKLVKAVKGYAEHERQVLVDIAESRARKNSVKKVAEQVKVENQLSFALNKFLLVAEKYPELKANETFLKLQEQLKQIEDNIAFARMFFNDTVMKYNLKVQTFPLSIIAAMCRFREVDYFDLDDNPHVRITEEVKR